MFEDLHLVAEDGRAVAVFQAGPELRAVIIVDDDERAAEWGEVGVGVGNNGLGNFRANSQA